MSVTFILGRSGTGKTALCVRQVCDALTAPGEHPLIFLVPEQATYQAERAVLSRPEIRGYHRLNILSFSRLEFLLTGRDARRPEISRIGQEMVIHKLLNEHAGYLNLFAGVSRTPGLARNLARLFVEFHEYEKTPDDLDALAASLETQNPHDLSALKFRDIARIYRAYLAFLQNRFINPDLRLSLACEKVRTADFLRDADLWVDGFASFTLQQQNLLIELIKAARRTRIALNLDPARVDTRKPRPELLDPVNLFHSTERTFAELFTELKKHKIPVEAPVLLTEPHRFADAPALRALEAGLFETEPAPPVSAGESVRIISAPTIRAEVRFIARRILSLVREHNIRYRQIAVIVSDIDTYQPHLQAAFDDYGIPLFIDKRRPLTAHPVVELLQAAFQALTTDFDTLHVLAFLKSDLAPLTRADADTLENYALAAGIDRMQWLDPEPWAYRPQRTDFDMNALNAIRRTALAPLDNLRQALGIAADDPLDAHAFIAAVWSLLNTLGIDERLKENPGPSALETHQLHELLAALLDEMHEIFAGAPQPPSLFIDLLLGALSRLTLALIPPTLDQVLVGTIERSRHPDLSAVFLAGVTQKDFPESVSFDAVLNEADRAAAEQQRFELAPNLQRRLTDRQYLAYIAMTRAARYLYLSYPQMDASGAPVTPSHFLTNLTGLYTDLRPGSYTPAPITPGTLYAPFELREHLCDALSADAAGRGDDLTEPLRLLASLRADARFAPLAADVLSALGYDNAAALAPDLAGHLFDEPLCFSTSQLSTFARCPYQHFARYVLNAAPRQVLRFEPVNLGDFYHRFLDLLYKALAERGLSWRSADEQTLTPLLDTTFETLIRENEEFANFLRHSHFHAYILHSAHETLRAAAFAYVDLARAGCFDQAAGELWFDHRSAVRCAIHTPAGRDIFLKGKIDRIDKTEHDGIPMMIVYDYKRRAQSLNFTYLYHGLDLQLPVYLLALRESMRSRHRPDRVIGGFYLPIEPADEKKPDAFKYKARGLFDGEWHALLDTETDAGYSPWYNFSFSQKDAQYARYASGAAARPEDFTAILDFARRRVAAIADGFLAGRIDITPYRLNRASACSSCDFRALCRFDWQINRYNLLAPVGKLEVINEGNAS